MSEAEGSLASSASGEGDSTSGAFAMLRRQPRRMLARSITPNHLHRIQMRRLTSASQRISRRRCWTSFSSIHAPTTRTRST